MLLATLGPCTSVVRGQTYLYNRADFAVGRSPYAVVAADFNGDGKLDLAVANRDDNTVSILLGKPDGTFAAQTVYPTGTSPVALVAADFNGDGKLDLAVVNNNPSGTGSVSILLGNGDGTFQSHVDYQVGAQPIGIVSADFNGDGKQDLAVANNLDSTVSILLGSGDGTFRTGVPIPLPGYPQTIAGGDFNGDGKQDLIVLNTKVSVLLSKGDGTFREVDTTLIPSPSVGIAVGDFNGDGKLDAVVGANQGGLYSPLVLLGNGDGTFLPPAPFAILAPIAGAIVTADFNHDGILDLAFAGTGFDAGPAIALGNGDGTFQDAISTVQVNSVTSFAGIGLGDFNGDGQIDIAEVTADTDAVDILLGDGDGTFGKAYTVQTASTGFTGPEVVADFNGDGKLDVATRISSSVNGGTVTALLGHGDGTLGGPISSSAGTAGLYAMGAGDFNGDGKMDLVVDDGGSVSVLLGNGDGSFQAPISTLIGATYTVEGIVVGDFSGDGKLDLAVNVYDSGLGGFRAVILLGSGDGTFVVGSSYVAPNGGIINSLVAADFNHDGKLDLALLDRLNKAVLVYLGNGNGSFQSPISYAINSSDTDVLGTADVNGDGILDLVAASEFGVSALLGNGDGTFKNHLDSTPPRFGGLQSLTIADVNGDGHPDLVGYGEGETNVMLGNGDGTFRGPLAYYHALNGGRVAAGDFNSDGIPDIAITSQTFTPAGTGVTLLLSAPVASIFPSSLNFASQLVGTSGAMQSATLYNGGSASLSLKSITTTGDFLQTNNCDGTLPVAANCAVNVTFTPAASGIRTGTLSFTDNSFANPQLVALTGTGIAPLAGVSPSTLNFASLPVGSMSAAQTVTLNNTGTAALTISSVATSGDFAQTNTCGASVAAGASCTINVTFTPTAEGSRAGTLTITDNNNGVASSTQTVALSGTGNAAVVGLAPSSVTFSGQLLSSTSAAQTVTLTNSGNVTLAISGIAAGGDYAQSNSCGASVAAGANCTISVTFTPTVVGLRGGTLTITDNAPGSPQTVTLSGMGTDFLVALASGSSNTATVTAGQTATFNLAFSGTAGFSGTVALTCSGAPSLATCSVTPNSLALNGTTPANTTVSVTTTARGMLLPQFYVLPPAPGTHEGLPLLIVLLTLATVAGMAWRRRGGRAPLAPTQALAVGLLLMVVLAAALMPGCGGGGTTTPVPQTPGTPAGTYTLDVAGKFTSGTVTTTHDIKLTLTVN
ncbi:MAG TPA: FG-GAP-like repeat-containing protein [Terriglobia bacterium]|nr:FG-GAP-like repeat-containing protein [Terriglobia bacterium]